MSKISMNKNMRACNNIDNAIKYYQEAYNKLVDYNTHSSAKEISNLISTEIDRLRKIKNRIYDVNSNISIQIKKNGSDES